jgi:hypothetical protein
VDFLLMMINWLVVSTPLKNMKVSWDDYSQYMENKKNVPNHQPVLLCCSNPKVFLGNL